MFPRICCFAFGAISTNIIMSVQYRKQTEETKYWKERCLFMESKYAPDANPFFDPAEIQEVQNDIICHYAGIPFMGTFMRWYQKTISRAEIQQIRKQKKWNRINDLK